MGLSIVRYQKKRSKTAQFGVLKKDKIVPIAGRYKSLADFLNRGQQRAKAASREQGTIDYNQVKILSPVTRPCRLLCQGVNYAKHRVEAGSDKAAEKINLYFRKDDSTIIGPTEDIKYPKNISFLDYEVEMGLVMGKTINTTTTVDNNNLGEYLAGIVLCNDVSVRDWMFTQPFGQWFKGKSPRNSSPIGPVFYLFENEADVEIINNLHIRLWMNEELRQDSHTSKLIIKPYKALTELSEWIDMEVGDVLMTGTPGGVSIRVPSPHPKGPEGMMQAQRDSGVVWLKPGDTLRAELSTADGSVQLGFQENKIV